MTSRRIWLIVVLFISGVTVTVLMLTLPMYNVYYLRMEGKAKLAEAEHSRQVAVEEARAALDAARFLAAAEVARAQGVADSIRVVGKALDGKEEYLRYLWISGLNDGKNEVIYVPTEAGLPILEAGKR